MTTSVDAVSGTHRGVGRARAAALVTACTLALLVDGGAAQDNLVRIEGRVLWIAAATMVVAPYPDSAPIKVDLSQVQQGEYMGLATNDAVSVTGTVPKERNRLIATSIQRLTL